MKAAVMLSDNRMEVIASDLEACGLTILRGRDEASIRRIEEEAGTLDALLLPIRGIDDRGYLHIPGVDYSAKGLLARLRPEAELITGLRTAYLNQLERKVVNYYDDEEVRRANSALTAEGVLYYFMDKTPRSMFTYRVDIIGYGYTGREIARLFARLGIAIRVVTDGKNRTAGGESFPMISYESWKQGKTFEVIINTAPAQVITSETAEHFPEEVLIIDIASNQVGVSRELYERRGVRVEPAPGLPGLVAEESAGRILADFLKRRWNLNG